MRNRAEIADTVTCSLHHSDKVEGNLLPFTDSKLFFFPNHPKENTKVPLSTGLDKP